MSRALRICILLAIGTLRTLLWPVDALAGQENEQGEVATTEEPNFVLEIAPAAEWSLHEERSNYGGTVALEKEVIENWLELEAGLTGLGTSGRGELSGDLLFKKRFRLSPELEFFVGVGPEVAHTFNGSGRGTLAHIEQVTELMFLPRTGVGWYLEPTFSVAPATGEKSFGLSAGVAIRF